VTPADFILLRGPLLQPRLFGADVAAIHATGGERAVGFETTPCQNDDSSI